MEIDLYRPHARNLRKMAEMAAGDGRLIEAASLRAEALSLLVRAGIELEEEQVQVHRLHLLITAEANPEPAVDQSAGAA
jgi:hypothetical protein